MRLLIALLLTGVLLSGVLWIVSGSGDSRGTRGAAVGTPSQPIETPVIPPAVRDERQRESTEAGPATEASAPAGFPHSTLEGTVLWSDRSAAVGVQVEVRHARQRGPALPLARVVSGEEGAFAVRVPGTGPFQVRAFAASGSGTRLEVLRNPVEAGEDGLRLRLPHRGRAEGQVLDDRNQPVEEFTLFLRRWEEDPPVRLLVHSEDGRFETQALAHGTWLLSVTAPGHDPGEGRLRVPSDDVKISLTRSARVQGFVRDRSGKPVEGARITVSGTESEATSAPDGAFDLECTGGSQFVSVDDARGTAPPPLWLDLRPGEVRTDVLLRLGPAGLVTGRLVDLYGSPAGGREVLLVPRRPDPEAPSLVCVTDALGVFRSPLAPGAWEARVELTPAEIEAWQQATGNEKQTEHSFLSETFVLQASERTEVWLALGPALVEVRGSLTKAGEPSPGGKLTAVDESSGMLARAEIIDSAYVLRLARGGRYRFVVTFGNASQLQWIDVPALGPHTLDLDVPVGWIDGHLRTTDGEPVPDAKVVAVGDNGGRGHAITEFDGAFSLELAPDRYKVSRDGEEDRWPWVRRLQGLEVRDGKRLTGLRLVTRADSDQLSLEVMLQTPRGGPVTEARVRLHWSGRNEWEERGPFVQEAPQGLARFYGLPGGNLMLEAEARGHLQLEERVVQIDRNETRQAVVDLSPTREVFVSIGAPPSAPSVNDLDAVDPLGRVFPALREDPEGPRPEGSPTPEAGRAVYRFAALPEGDFLLRAFAGAEVREHPVHVEHGGRDALTLEFP